MNNEEKEILVEDVLSYVIKRVRHYLENAPMKITTEQLCKYLETIKYREIKALDPSHYFSKYDNRFGYR